MANQIVFPNNPVKYASSMTSISQERKLQYKEIKWSIQGKMLLSFHRRHRRNSELGSFPTPGPRLLPESKLSAGMGSRRWGGAGWNSEWTTALFKAEWVRRVYDLSPVPEGGSRLGLSVNWRGPRGSSGYRCFLISNTHQYMTSSTKVSRGLYIHLYHHHWKRCQINFSLDYFHR